MAYISLKDLYLEEVAGIPVPPLPRQQVNPTQQQGTFPSQNVASSSPIKVFVPGNEYVPQTQWSAYGISPELFEKTAGGDKEGTGRGEYSVACMLYGFKTKEQVDNAPGKIIQGGGTSFDVVGPDNRKYEVKELTDAVRTGTEGTEVFTDILTTAIDLIDAILKEFNTLDNEGKQIINNMILNSNTVKNTILNRKSQKGYFDAIKDRWSLDDYLTDIRRKAPSELSKGILIAPIISLGFYAKKRPHVIFSLRQLVDVLNEIASAPVAPGVDAGTTNPAVKDIADTINKHYSVQGDEREKDFFEKEAEKIDRALVQKRCKVFKKCTDEISFRTQIKALNLNEMLNVLVQKTQNIIKRLFPNDGLFAVNSQGFQYIPHEKLNDYIEFDTLSSGKVKIRQKIQQGNETV